MKKTSLIVLSAIALSGCGAVDDIINETLSGDVTTETIAAKEKILIINNVSYTACAVIKNGLVTDDDLNNAETLVTELGVTCQTYGKDTGDVLDPDAACIEQSLSEWIDDGNIHIISKEDAEGTQACVIGADI
ncbi:MAG: hypothetical protein GQ531_02690 [Sulfurovum sp.]|nr:hypothetical protein [Sulfurovum sp.]